MLQLPADFSRSAGWRIAGAVSGRINGLIMAKIHPSSIVEAGAILADDVEVGPLCYVGPNVKIGAGTKLLGQCRVDGYTEIGCNNVIYPFASLGMSAQDVHVEEGKKTYLKVGDNNIFRENFTAHTGTMPETVTTIGNNCLFMANSHVAHNCTVKDHVILVNSVALAGYCEVGDHAIISGLSGIHQFCRVGRFAIVSGGSAFSQDVPPFMMAEGRNGGVKMINLVGLKRGGFSDEAIRVIKDLFKIYYLRGLSPRNALEAVKTQLPQTDEVKEFIAFCESSKRGVLPPRIAGKRS